MIELFVLYPKEYTCWTKFERKLNKILRFSQVETLYFQHDNNNLINRYMQGNQEYIRQTKLHEGDFNNITHAIVFSDGELFQSEIRKLRELNITIRIIEIRLTRVINISELTKYKGVQSTKEYEYIGRGSYWGNPYSMFNEGETRDEVIRKYKYDFDYEKFPHIEKSNVYKLAGKKLGCFCKPNNCHGDVLADYLNNWDDGK